MQVAEQALIATRVGLQILIPDEPDTVRESRERNKFIITKHVYGFAGDDSGAGEHWHSFHCARMKKQSKWMNPCDTTALYG